MEQQIIDERFEKMLREFMKQSKGRIRDFKDREYNGKKEKMKQRRNERRQSKKW